MKKKITENKKMFNFSKKNLQTVALLTGAFQQKYPAGLSKKELYKSLKLFFPKATADFISYNNISSSNTHLSLMLQENEEAQKKRFFNQDSLTINKKYLIIRLSIQFTNLNFSLTNLTGKILSWCSGGSIGNQTRRTRLTSRTVGILLNTFLTSNKNLLQKKYIKIVFCGPSRRFRGKLFSIIKKKQSALKSEFFVRKKHFEKVSTVVGYIVQNVKFFFLFFWKKVNGNLSKQ